MLDTTTNGVALFLMSALETVFPPLAGPVLPLAGIAVSDGEISLWTTIAIGTVGSTAGSLVLYAISRGIGQDRVRGWLLDNSSWSNLSEKHFDRADAWFERRGQVVVLVGRCVPVIRSLVSIPAGLVPMPILRFTALTFVGNLLWSASVVGVAAELGDRLGVIRGPSRWVQLAVALAWVLLLLSAVVVWAIRKRRVRFSYGAVPELGRVNRIEDLSD